MVELQRADHFYANTSGIPALRAGFVCFVSNEFKIVFLIHLILVSDSSVLLYFIVD